MEREGQLAVTELSTGNGLFNTGPINMQAIYVTLLHFVCVSMGTVYFTSSH